MTGNLTLTMIKPDAVESNYTGIILDKILKSGFKIRAMKLMHLSSSQAGQFYAVHKERPFFGSLVSYMSSGPIVVAILEKANAIESFRTLIGSTDPSQAAEGTIRRQFGKSIAANAIHGSDSDANAIIESNFFFSGVERMVT